MASMSDVLASIPGYGGYIAKRAMNEQQDMDQLRKFGAMQAIYTNALQQQQAQAALQATTEDRARNEAVRREVMALPPEQRTRENVLPIIMRYATNAKDIAGMLPAKTGQSIGSGGLRLEDGTVIPPAARPDQPMKAPPIRQRYDGENVIQEELQADGTWKEVGRGPRFAKTVQGPQSLPKPPAGYRYKADGSGEQEPIPGGPVDIKQRGLAAGAKRSVELTSQNIDALDAALADLEKDPGLTRITGPVYGRTGNFTGAATGAQAKLNTIKNQVFVSTLQAMREASKTGGAVGNVSDKEGERLENSLAALDQAQTTEDFQRQLKVVRARLRNSKATIQRAYNEQFPGAGGDAAPAAPVQPAAPAGQQPAIPGGWSITPVR